jgi:hypothetical protein
VLYQSLENPGLDPPTTGGGEREGRRRKERERKAAPIINQILLRSSRGIWWNPGLPKVSSQCESCIYHLPPKI